MFTFANFFAVGLGAALGAIARWILGLWLNQGGVLLPWGTLAANLVGGYLIGVALGAFLFYPSVPEWLKLFATTGFLGGLTTFSTFSAETVGLLERGSYFSALGYAGISLFGALALTALGLAAMHALR